MSVDQDAQLEQLAKAFEDGVTEQQLEGAEWIAGPRAFLLDVVSDWDALVRRAEQERTSPEDVIRRAVDAYLVNA